MLSDIMADPIKSQMLFGLGAGLLQASGAKRGIGAGLGQGMLYAQQFGGDAMRQQAYEKQSQREDEKFKWEKDEHEDESRRTDEQRAAMNAALRGAPVEVQQAVAIGGPEAFNEWFKAQNEPGKTRQINRGGSIVDQEWDPQSRQWNEIGSGPRFAPTQPREAPAPIFEDFNLGDGKGVEKRVSYDRGQTWQAFGAPEQPSDETSAAMRLRGRKIDEYQSLYGVDLPTATSIADGLSKPIDTADGRVILYTPDGKTKDITPKVKVPGEDIAAPASPSRANPGLGHAVGVGPVTSEAVSRTVGQFVGGANNPDVTRARTDLGMLKKDAMGAMVTRGNPSNWEQQQIEALFPSEGLFESEPRARESLSASRDAMAAKHAQNRQALADPALQGGDRADIIMQNQRIEGVVSKIDSMLAAGQPSPVAPPTGGEAVYEMRGGKLVKVQ
jgi:hypothetical protein